jgi:hypothetical protein
MRRAWIAIGLACLAACAGADAMTLHQPASVGAEAASSLGLVPGENMAFEVRIAGVLAGEAQLAVGDLGEVDGRNALVVRSRAATAGAAALIKKISDESTTVIDVDTGLPISLDAVIENNGKRMTASATFSGSTAVVTYQRHIDKAPRTTRLDFGKTTVYDAHTAMAQLRGWKAAKGATRTVYVIGGRRLWRIDVTHGGSEAIGSALGNRRAVKFKGKSYRARANMAIESDRPTRTFSVWLSDDADRVPLKVVATTELGDIVMDLTEYNN